MILFQKSSHGGWHSETVRRHLLCLPPEVTPLDRVFQACAYWWPLRSCLGEHWLNILNVLKHCTVGVPFWKHWWWCVT